MILVDTRYFIALLDPDDQYHQKARKLAGDIKDEVLVVSEYVLLEFVSKFSVPKGSGAGSALERVRATGHAIVEEVSTGAGYELIRASAHLFNAGLDMHRSSTGREWSLTECISFHIMNDRGIKHALACDCHFQEAGFKPLLVDSLT